MPLSDEEARLLAQLEQSLAEEDPDFASTLRGSKLAARHRKIVALAAVAFVIGMGLLLGGAVTASTWLGAIGFVVMVGASYAFIRTWRQGMIGGDEAPAGGGGPRGGKPQSGSFVDRMEERWNRRQDDGR
ncbi:hypothetical protein BHE97_10765 [Aeromicrobium sp. PE09-221]|uniref:DUF3040 domain-containing protein n=1 Tax=Aeromicrobium sp. PE09-221 TaxID=1898043 RepID=UPI000B6E3D49|nr:DUF3040 domain-containing protein [Aeromicrobium sp. PE09-221]OUZ09524.1 hypothetical protein BHE97_10765 [Aeromicrobium sp. PE09-221]